jgi:hypothetical protein
MLLADWLPVESVAGKLVTLPGRTGQNPLK